MSPSNRRRGGGRRGGGRFGGMIFSGILLLLCVGAVLAIIRSNEITDIEDMRVYLIGQGNRYAECIGTPIATFGDEGPNCSDWSFVPPSQGGDGGSFDPPEASNGSNGDSDSGSSEGRFDGGNFDDSDFNVPYSVSDFGNGIISGGPENYVAALSESVNIADESDVDYDRSDWRHWTGSPCNTRQDVLIKQGNDVETDDDCRITAGSWYDPFTGETTEDSSSLDIDHIVPLGYAASHGGNDWSEDRKEEFANDHLNLRAVSASENRSKGADGPSDYMPPNEEHHCEYAIIWVDTVYQYDLSVTAADRRALEDALATC